MPGVRAVRGRAATGSIRIDYDPYRLAERSIVERLDEMTAELGASPASATTRAAPRPRQALAGAPLLRLLGATTALVGTCCLPVPPAIAAGLAVATSVPALLRGGAALARRRRLDGDVLEASTLALLVFRRSFTAAALLTWLRALGEFAVDRSIVTARRSLGEAVGLADRTVTRRVDDRRETVSVEALRAGDVIVVGAGAPILVDGTIAAGEAMINQQTMTGEALPVERGSGDQVFAATTVEHGEIEIDVERVGAETAVGRIVSAIEVAAAEKPDIQVFAERLADREVARTLTLAGLGAVFSRSVDAALAILVADYGTAARVGIPAVMIASLRHATREGILIKGPRTLELLARVDTVVFDKTGTLTSGTPHATRIVSYDGSFGEDALIRLTAAAERGLGHPVARAVNRLARERRLIVPAVTSAAPSVGLGIDVRLEGRHALIGSRRLMERQHIGLDAARDDEAAAHAVGASPIFIAVDGRLAGMLVLQDRLRDEAPDAVRALRARKMRNVILLSGDHPEPSRVIAESLGLRHHYAELSPQDKARLVRDLKAEGRVVAMVGDGVNDAPALEVADVGIAVPGGAEVAVEAADVVLLGGGLDRVVRALDLAGDGIHAVRRTLGIAARANLAVVGLASLGWARPLTSIALSHGTTIAAALLTTTPGRIGAPSAPAAG